MKKILGLLLVTSSIFSMQLQLTDKRHNFQEKLYRQDILKHADIQKVSTSVFVPHALGSAQLYHGPKGFYVHHDNKMKRIQKCFTDPVIRNITSQQANDFHTVGHFHLTQMNVGEYSLNAKPRLIGGGAGGATVGFYVCKFATYFVCHGAIIVVSALTGPAAGATFAGLEACFAPHIELASQATSLAGGIIGAVATGPV